MRKPQSLNQTFNVGDYVYIKSFDINNSDLRMGQIIGLDKNTAKVRELIFGEGLKDATSIEFIENLALADDLDLNPSLWA
jgi:hypothetical protein